MSEERKKEFIWAMINFINDSNIGVEALEGYIESNNLWEEWNTFKEEV